ncbi:MAG: very short patch repair endonuclease [Nitrospinota bacterium]|nr:very short patch repair endonuclease [Nitrospinota bacterium]
MAVVKSRDTVLEMALRRALFGLGLRYRLGGGRQLLPGNRILCSFPPGWRCSWMGTIGMTTRDKWALISAG